MESNADIEKAEYIDRYLKGDLSETERAAFEHRLLEDEAFAEEVERLRSMRSIIRNYGQRKDLAAIHQQAIAQRKKKGVFYVLKPVMRVAATITLVLVCALVIRMFTLSQDSLQQQYEAYEKETTRGEEVTTYSIGERLLQEYANGNYHAVVQLYERSPVRSIRETFITANAYLALAQADKAIPLLRKVMAESNRSGDFTYYQDAEYYLAWAYLKNNQLREADAFFTRVYSNPYHQYHANVNWQLYWQVKLLRLKQGV